MLVMVGCVALWSHDHLLVTTKQGSHIVIISITCAVSGCSGMHQMLPRHQLYEALGLIKPRTQVISRV